MIRHELTGHLTRLVPDLASLAPACECYDCIKKARSIAAGLSFVLVSDRQDLQARTNSSQCPSLLALTISTEFGDVQATAFVERQTGWLLQGNDLLCIP